MEKEYIERDEAIRAAIAAHIKVVGHGVSHIDAVDIAEAIEEIPAADVAKVRHGEWKAVYSNNMSIVYECSECGHLALGTSDYCICGAKMDGKGEK